MLLATAILAGSLSAGAAPREFYGTVSIKTPTAKQFDRMGRGRVGTIRALLYWGGVQALGPQYHDWSDYDPIVRRAARNRIRVLPMIFGSPGWAARQVKFPPRPGRRDEFKAFVRAAVERYGSGGSFWAANPGLPQLPFRWWQLWNEENSPTFWSRRPSAKSYKRLLAPASRAIRAADPSAKVLLGGLFPTPAVRGAISMQRFLKGLYRAGAKSLFDGVAVHPYARTPGKALEVVDDARRTMRRHGDGKTPVWITEVGWATSGQRTAVTVKPRVQARYLRQTFTMAARSRKRRHIAGVLWYSFKDTRRRVWIYRTGMFTAAGKPKPSWRAFVRLTGGRP